MEKLHIAPTPWTILQEGTEDDCITRTIIASGNRPRNLSEVALVTTGSFTDEVEADNAKLIAAAPDLFQALMMAKETIKIWHLMGNDDMGAWALYQSSPEMKVINTAIEKVVSGEKWEAK